MNEAREIAESLGERQRRCILALSRTPQFAARHTFNGRTALTMANHLTLGIYDPLFRRDRWCLTPLGLEVRGAILNPETSHHG